MEGKDKSKEEVNMAALTYPAKAPIEIKAGRFEHFIEKCKKGAISKERKEELIKYSKSMREKNDK